MKLKAALIGFGYWGRVLARNINSHPKLSLSTIVECDPSALKEAQDMYGVETYSSLSNIPRGSTFDVIFVATRPTQHLSVSMEAFALTSFLVLPKPVTTSLKEAKLLIEKAKANGAQVYCDYTYRYSDVYLALKNWSNDNQMLEYVSFRQSLGIYQSDVSVIEDLAVHDLSILAGLKNSRPTFIQAMDTSPFKKNGRTTAATLFLGWEDGFKATIHVSWNSMKKFRNITLRSSKSAILVDEVNQFRPISMMEFSPGIDTPTIESKDFEKRNIGITIGEETFLDLRITESLAREIDFIYQKLTNVSNPPTLIDLNDSLAIWETLNSIDWVGV